MKLTFEPLLEEQRLAASGNHASTVEVHESGHPSCVEFWRQVEVELYVEGLEPGVSDCLHSFLERNSYMGMHEG